MKNIPEKMNIANYVNIRFEGIQKLQNNIIQYVYLNETSNLKQEKTDTRYYTLHVYIAAWGRLMIQNLIHAGGRKTSAGSKFRISDILLLYCTR